MLQLSLSEKKEPKEIVEYSVSQLSVNLKKLVEANFSFIKVRGEVSGFKLAATGHGYFNIKDDVAVLACTCWKPIMQKLEFAIADGVEVIVFGKLTTYAGMSRYQLNVEAIMPSGDGALMAILKERKDRLAKEGLFDVEHKKAIPYFPEKIGVVTSSTGAVIQDILHRIQDRFPTHVIIWPVAVQGQSASAEIARAINGFSAMEESMRPDVIIVARGGGSIEDLWAFNEEAVVRAVYNCSIPVISAIGHETDFTLIDLVSDLRAPTPTAAAEFAVPVKAEIVARIAHYFSSLINNMAQIIKHNNMVLNFNGKMLDNPLQIFDYWTQRLDDIAFKFPGIMENFLKIKNLELARFSIKTQSLDNLLAIKIDHISFIWAALKQKATQILQKQHQLLEFNVQLLEASNVEKTLKRGFAVITKNGALVSDLGQMQIDDVVNIKLHNGEAKVLVNSLSPFGTQS